MCEVLQRNSGRSLKVKNFRHRPFARSAQDRQCSRTRIRIDDQPAVHIGDGCLEPCKSVFERVRGQCMRRAATAGAVDGRGGQRPCSAFSKWLVAQTRSVATSRNPKARLCARSRNLRRRRSRKDENRRCGDWCGAERFACGSIVRGRLKHLPQQVRRRQGVVLAGDQAVARPIEGIETAMLAHGRLVDGRRKAPRRHAVIHPAQSRPGDIVEIARRTVLTRDDDGFARVGNGQSSTRRSAMPSRV